MKKFYFIAVLIMFFSYGCAQLPERTDKNIEEALIEKAQRVGLYLAAAKQAEEEGNSQASVYLGELAEEEIEHIKKLSIIQASTGRNTKRSLKKIAKIEKNAAHSRYPKMSRNARDEKNAGIADLFNSLAQDEDRHYSGVNGMIRKY